MQGIQLNGENEMNINKRFFIVGVPRSGTTLLQSLLSSHSSTMSFPETHFFTRVANGSLKSRFPLYMNYKYYKILQDTGLKLTNKLCLSEKCMIKHFINELDSICISKNKVNWIEKTPMHLHHIKTIMNNVPNAYFIHLIRNGKDTISSLYDVTSKYSNEWGGKRSVKECLDRWNNDLSITENYIGHPNHYVVRYEDLSTNTEDELIKIFEWMNLKYEENILTKYFETASKVITDKEAWKGNNLLNHISRSNSKFKSVFSQEDQSFIINNLKQNIFYKVEN